MTPTLADYDTALARATDPARSVEARLDAWRHVGRIAHAIGLDLPRRPR